jgi:hypothetical protein
VDVLQWGRIPSEKFQVVMAEIGTVQMYGKVIKSCNFRGQQQSRIRLVLSINIVNGWQLLIRTSRVEI